MPPLVLAFDTATDVAACCLWRDGDVLAERTDDGRHAAQRVLALADAALDEAGVRLDDVGAVVVGTGPGSFTGIRLGIAAGRAIALGLGIPVAGVSTLDALRAEAGPGAVAVIDARRGEVFASGPGLEPTVASPAELARRLGPGPVLCIGDGARRYRDVLGDAEIPPDDDPRHRARACAHARLASRAGFRGATDPCYLRRPDAEAAA